jgi:prophage tail gpP-like protein
MQPDTGPRNPELDSVTLELPEAGIVITNWESYGFDSDFLTPSDGFHFQIGDDVTDQQLDALQSGAEVVLKINDAIQASGYIDDVDIWSDRSSGTRVAITGRDKLAYAVDSGVDPRLQINEGQTLEDLVADVLVPFGFRDYLVDNEANRDVLKGKRGSKTTKKGKPLKSFVLHQTKPYPNEGAFQFVARVAQRHGLWIWATADGTALVIGKPDFDQAPSYHLRRKRGDGERSQNNVLTGNVRRAGMDQPSVILASGFSGGGDFPHAGLRSAVVNPAVIADVASVINAWPTVKFLQTNFSVVPFENKRARPVYIHDPDSKTQEQLDNFVLRELSLRMRKAVTASYSVAGHISNGAVWTVDTIVNVDDDVGRLHEPMWVLGRSFYQSRSGGTLTQLELIRPGSLVF